MVGCGVRTEGVKKKNIAEMGWQRLWRICGSEGVKQKKRIEAGISKERKTYEKEKNAKWVSAHEVMQRCVGMEAGVGRACLYIN